MGKIANALMTDLAELRDQFTRANTQHKCLADEQQSNAMSALQEVENKLRREMSAIGEQNHDSVNGIPSSGHLF